MKALFPLVLIGSAVSFATDNFVWKPYSFRSEERYTFLYREVFKKEEGSGRFKIFVKREGDGFRIRIEGRYRNKKGSVEGTFKSAYELAGFVLMKMYFDHPWLIPLGRTVLSRGLVRALHSKPLDWSLGRRELGKGVFRTVRKCRFGGLEGRMLEVVEEKEVVFKLCASPSASLPVYLYRKEKESNLYEIELIEFYSSEKGL